MTEQVCEMRDRLNAVVDETDGVLELLSAALGGDAFRVSLKGYRALAVLVQDVLRRAGREASHVRWSLPALADENAALRAALDSLHAAGTIDQTAEMILLGPASDEAEG